MASLPANSDFSVQEAIERLQFAVIDDPVVHDLERKTESMQEKVFLECEKFKDTVKKEAVKFREKLHSIESSGKNDRNKRIGGGTSDTNSFDTDSDDYYASLEDSLKNSVAGFSVFSSVSGGSEPISDQLLMQSELRVIRSSSPSEVDSDVIKSSESGLSSPFVASSSYHQAQQYPSEKIVSTQAVDPHSFELDSKQQIEPDYSRLIGNQQLKQHSFKVTAECLTPSSSPGTPKKLTFKDPQSYDSPVPSPIARDYPLMHSIPSTPMSMVSSVVSTPISMRSILKPSNVVQAKAKQKAIGTVSSVVGSPMKHFQPMSPIRAKLLKSPVLIRRNSGTFARTRLGSDSVTTLLEDAKLSMEQLCYRADPQTFDAVLGQILNIAKTRISNSSNELTEIAFHFFKLLVTYPKFVYHGAALCYKIYEDSSGGDVFLATVLRQCQSELQYVLKIVCTVPFMDKRLLGLIWFLAELYLNLTGEDKRLSTKPKFVVLAIADLLRMLLDVRNCPYLIKNFHCAVQVLKVIASSLSDNGSKSTVLILEGLMKLRSHCKILERSGSLSFDLKKALVCISLQIQLLQVRLEKKSKRKEKFENKTFAY